MDIQFKKLPLATIILATIFAVGLIVFIGAFSKKNAFSKFNLWGGKETVIESQNKDTDSDGLLDWQENLYGSDLSNPDTDADGYLDGEEINSGNNPLIKGPNDKLIFHPLPLGDQYNITKKVLNSDVIDSLIESYLLQKNEYINNNDITSPEEFAIVAEESTIEEMFTRALGDAYPILIEKAGDTISQLPEIFDINIAEQDIKVSEDNSSASIKEYITQISSLLKSNTFFLQEQSLLTVSSALTSGEFSLIDTIIKDNDNKIEDLRNVAVPSSWKEIHKKGLELTYLIRNIFVSFRDIQNDPLKAYVALQKLEKFSGAWNKLMEEAINLAKQQNIEISF